MSEFIAVHDYFLMAHFRNFKREALMFDRIALPHASSAVSFFSDSHPKNDEMRNELEWLLEQGIIFDPGVIDDEDHLSRDPDYKEIVDYREQLISQLYQVGGITYEDVVNESDVPERRLTAQGQNFRYLLGSLFGLQARQISIQLRLLQNADACPILASFLPRSYDIGAKDGVIEVILNEFPVPDDQTPWEQILEFRDNPDSRSRFFALKEWMNEVARLELPPNEVLDKFNALITDYTEHLKVHKMKTRQETLRTLLFSEGFFTGASLSTWGNLVTKAGMVVSPLFTIAQHRLKLLEGETNAPGREIAYIMKAKRKFTD